LRTALPYLGINGEEMKASENQWYQRSRNVSISEKKQ